MAQAFEMFPIPVPFLRDLHVTNQRSLPAFAGRAKGNRQPLHAIPRLDAVTIAPTVVIILHVVIENEDVRFPDLVKIAAPWYIRGL